MNSVLFVHSGQSWCCESAGRTLWKDTWAPKHLPASFLTQAVRLWAHPCRSTNRKDAWLSETPLLVHFSTWSGRSETEKPYYHFSLFWRTWGKLFAQTVDTAAAKKILLPTTTVSEVHYMNPDNSNLCLWFEVINYRFEYYHCCLTSKLSWNSLFIFVWVAFLENLSHT